MKQKQPIKNEEDVELTEEDIDELLDTSKEEEEAEVSEEETVEEETVEEEESTEEEEESSPLVVQLKQELELLKARLNELQQNSSAPTQEQQESSVLVSEEEFETLDYQKFNEVLNRTYQKAVADATQKLLHELPAVIETRKTAEEKAKAFFKKHKELERHRDFVSYVARSLAAKHPEWSEQKLLDETARIAKKELGIKTATNTVTAPISSRVPKGKSVTGIEKDIQDLLGG